MKFFLTLFFLLIFFLNGFSQDEQEQQIPQQGKIEVKTNRLYGKLLDQYGKPIEAASVLLYYQQGRSADSLFKAMLSKPNGDFGFSDLSLSYHTYKIVVSAVGYEPFEKEIEINVNDDKSFEEDLGNITLISHIKQLSAVIVSASKPGLQMGIDRKVFNVDKNITSAGGTAIDVMRNIPSLSVDIDGNVQMRNSSPQIFIDGRPTILTLDQIPSDHIERIELITNPSAKFDAASSGGIINIVLKKNKRVGFNGLASISGGTPSLYSSHLNLNLRQGKLNFFASAGYNHSGGVSKGQTKRENKDNGVITNYFNQSSSNERSRRFTSVRMGMDYFIDNRNTLTLSQSFVRGRFGNDETQHQDYLDANKVLEYYGERESNDKSGFNRKSSRVSFKHSFPKQDKEFTAGIDYNYGTHSGNTDIVNSYFNPDNSVYQPSVSVRNEGSNNDKQLIVQADFTNPITERSKLETGIRSYYDHSSNWYNAFSVDNGQETKLPLSNNYAYNEMINAAYVTYSNKNKKETFSYQFGVRAEYSKFTGNMIDSVFKFGYEYPNKIGELWNALFPSFFLSQKINDDNELQFNFTRRIRRPQFWELNPYIDISDPLNLRQGNPQLKPEFINSFELNYSKNYKGGNFLASVYYKNNPKDITQYSDTLTAAQYQQLNNAAVDPNAILNTYVNANVTNRYGAEFTLQQKIGNNFDFTPSLNLQYRKVKATISDLSLSNQGFNWQSKLIMNYKIQTDKASLFNNMSFQFSGEYESPRVIPQGKQIAGYDADFAMRKDFLKDKKAALIFAINDVFNSRKWGTIYDTEQFYQDSYRRWNVRNFRLTFTYKFGDPNFTIGKRGGNGGGDNED